MGQVDLQRYQKEIAERDRAVSILKNELQSLSDKLRNLEEAVRTEAVRAAEMEERGRNQGEKATVNWL